MWIRPAIGAFISSTGSDDRLGLVRQSGDGLNELLKPSPVRDVHFCEFDAAGGELLLLINTEVPDGAL